MTRASSSVDARAKADVRGKTIRLSWTDGPTKGSTQEHVFHSNGTVEWHSLEKSTDKAGKGSKVGKGSQGSEKASKIGAETQAAEKPKYVSEKVADQVALISYLSKSGYTLTVALNFDTGTTVGVASNDKTWMPVHGRFEVIH